MEYNKEKTNFADEILSWSGSLIRYAGKGNSNFILDKIDETATPGAKYGLRFCRIYTPSQECQSDSLSISNKDERHFKHTYPRNPDSPFQKV